MNMDRLHVDFRTHSRTMSDDRGCFYESTNRALVMLPNHESYDDIISTIVHESIHFCLRDEDDIDNEQEEEIIFRMSWAYLSI